MKQQQGFTLIELIIVIVILGILAVTAAPRFIDIQSDARKETMQGVRAALQGSTQLVYAKSAIKGVQNADESTITIGSDTVDVKFGYPDASKIASAADIKEFLDIELGDDNDTTQELSYTDVTTANGDPSKFRITFTSIAITGTAAAPIGCFLEYTNPSAKGETPTFDVIKSDC